MTSDSGGPMIKRGAFIVFEGLDRSGKSTQVSLLRQVLEKMHVPVCEMNFPDRQTHIGQSLDAYLSNVSNVQDNAIHLLFSANRWEKQQDIRNTLNEGTTIVCGRYAHSGVAYSHVKGLDMEWCRSPDRGIVAPDLLIFLDVDAQAAAQRSDYGKERYEKVEIQSRVRESFMELFRREEQESQGVEEKEECVHVLDASKPANVIHEEIARLVREAIARAEQSQVKTLWPQ